MTLLNMECRFNFKRPPERTEFGPDARLLRPGCGDSGIHDKRVKTSRNAKANPQLLSLLQITYA